mmetsp:Transcript_38269/g.81684  ORF Transcript_38269/g.81684 Transcript_38269/m.81684 type:complete len:207 (+) Transcript_38269:974-1594(+)
MTFSRNNPGGARPVAFTSMERLDRSDSMESATPGYCTLTATFVISDVVEGDDIVPRWTWPIEAAANGRSSNLILSLQPSPHSSSNCRINCPCGMASAPLRTCARAFVNAGGAIDSSWMLNICPSFMAAPRILLSDSDRRCAFASLERTSGPLLPFWDAPKVRRASSATVPMARPAPREAKPKARERRVEGTALPSRRCGLSSSSSL